MVLLDTNFLFTQKFGAYINLRIREIMKAESAAGSCYIFVEVGSIVPICYGIVYMKNKKNVRRSKCKSGFSSLKKAPSIWYPVRPAVNCSCGSG